MATNTQKGVRKLDSEANPEPSSMVPKKGNMNKKLSKQEREEIARSLKQSYSFTGISAVDTATFLFSVVLSLDST